MNSLLVDEGAEVTDDDFDTILLLFPSTSLVIMDDWSTLTLSNPSFSAYNSDKPTMPVVSFSGPFITPTTSSIDLKAILLF